MTALLIVKLKDSFFFSLEQDMVGIENSPIIYRDIRWCPEAALFIYSFTIFASVLAHAVASNQFVFLYSFLIEGDSTCSMCNIAPGIN